MSRSKRVLKDHLVGSTMLAGAARIALIPISVCLGVVTTDAHAQVWTGTADNDYANTANWAPALVPNAANASATFDDGPSRLSINLGQAIDIASFVFGANTSAYTINVLGPTGILTVGGTDPVQGFINTVPGQMQTVRIGSGASLIFQDDATIQDTIVQIDPSGTFTLSDNASGGNGRIIVNGTAILSPGMGYVMFGSLEGSGSVQIASGATLATGGNDRDATFAGSFSGGGSLEVEGAGTFTVTGNSTLGGDLTICCSNLVIKGDFDVGGDAIVNGGSLTVTDGGWLRAAGAAGTMDGDITISNGGRLNASAFGILLGGSFTVTGSGSVATSDVASFASLLASGTLTVLNGGRLVTTGDAEIGVNVTANVDGTGSSWNVGQTLFVGEDSIGPGFLALTNGGQLSAGAVSIAQDSTLQVGAGGRAGILSTPSVTNLGALVFNHSDKTSFGGAIAGTGTLTKQGTGSLTLSGASTYTGATQVEGGTLRVTGSLTSPVNVGPGATLAGYGTIGGFTAQSGAVVAPGNVTDPLNVSGNVLFYADSAFAIGVNPVGQADRIDADGTATLQGGSVQVLAQQGTYNPSTTYTILTAKGGVTGRFANATANFAFLTPSLDYSTNSVTLTLKRTVSPPTPIDPVPNPIDPVPTPIDPVRPIAFHTAAVTQNQYKTADAVEALGEGNPLFKAVLSQTTAGAREAFNALSGEMHASAVTSAFHDASLLQNTLLSHLNRPVQSGGTGDRPSVLVDYSADRPGAVPQAMPLPAFDQRRFALWGEGIGAWGRTRSDGNAASIDSSTGGFIIGAEMRPDAAYRFGIAGGYTHTKTDADSRFSSETNESIFGALYGSAQWGAMALRLGTSYANHNFDSRRNVVFPLFSDTTTASYGGSTLQAFGELGYRFGGTWGHVEPFVGASALQLRKNGFQENGGAAALTGYGSTYSLGTTTLGVRAEARVGADNAVTLYGMAGWRHAFGDVDPVALLAFAGGASAFTVAGIPLDRDAFVAEAGLDWQITNAMSLGATYSGQVGQHSQDHAVKGNFVLRF